MRYFELPWHGPHPLSRTTATALLLLGIGAVLARLSLGNWTPELLILLLVALTLVLARAGEREARSDRSYWKPWRGPHPVRNTLSLVFLAMAGASLLADPLFVRWGDAGPATEAVLSTLPTALLSGSALAQTGTRGWCHWLSQFAWGCLMAFSAWQLYGVLAR
jgi:hypothetical protein